MFTCVHLCGCVRTHVYTCAALCSHTCALVWVGVFLCHSVGTTHLGFCRQTFTETWDFLTGQVTGGPGSPMDQLVTFLMHSRVASMHPHSLPLHGCRGWEVYSIRLCGQHFCT